MDTIDINSPGYALALRFACLSGLDEDLALGILMFMAETNFDVVLLGAMVKNGERYAV